MMISVCIATYNGERFIEEQLRSILPQLKEGDEVVVSDDGSTDRTLHIVSAMQSPLVRIVHNEGEHGYTPNFENALRHARGDVIFLSDQDDVWAPEKVKTTLRLMQEADLVISDSDIIDENGQQLAPSYFEKRQSRQGFWRNIYKFSYLGCALAFRRCLLEKALPFPPNHRYCTHDNWVGIVGMAFYRTVYCTEKLFHYRRHQGNISEGGLHNSTSLAFKIAYRIYLLRWLLVRRLS